MVKVTSKRGTSTTEVENVKNWAGDAFKKVQKERLDLAGGNTKLSQKEAQAQLKQKIFQMFHALL